MVTKASLLYTLIISIIRANLTIYTLFHIINFIL